MLRSVDGSSKDELEPPGRVLEICQEMGHSYIHPKRGGYDGFSRWFCGLLVFVVVERFWIAVAWTNVAESGFAELISHPNESGLFVHWSRRRPSFRVDA
jgi:hypothetical protein